MKSEWDPVEHESVPQRMQQLADLRERCPVAWTDHGGGHWVLLKYNDIVAATRDTQTFANANEGRHGVPLPPLETDPPIHRDYRFLLNPFFVPKRVQGLEPRVREIAERLLEPLLAKGGGDLAVEFSLPLPVLTLCALLDLPDELWPEIKRLSVESLWIESKDEHERQRARDAHLGMMAHARALIADRRSSPRDPATDICAAIVNAQIGGQPIDDDTGAAMIRLLISAGHNSTTSGLGNALLYLAEHPTEQQRLREQPQDLPAAIEELLRYETPVQSMPRYIKKDVTLHDRELRDGERLDLVFGSANRDAEVFADAERCILDRKPNRHMAFGQGIHTCLGAPIARMEMRVALELLLQKTRSFRVAGPVRRPIYHRLGVDALPISFAT